MTAHDLRADDAALMASDVRAADTLLDGLLEVGFDLSELLAARLEARGLIAAHLAEVRAAAYTQGIQDGRRQAGGLVREALRGEGL